MDVIEGLKEVLKALKEEGRQALAQRVQAAIDELESRQKGG